MATEWELINRNADYYLDTVNRAYETQKLNNDYLDLMNEAANASVGIQNKISEQMKQQLEYLREKDNLSEYDIAYARAQLEILKATIALEEARNAKNQMRLRRDSQGNYRYQYVADKDDNRDKEDALLEAQNNAYNLSKEQMKQTQADYLSALQNVKQQIQDINNDVTLSEEERDARSRALIASFVEYANMTAEQLGTSQNNIVQDVAQFSQTITEENQGRLTEIFEALENGQYEIMDSIDTRWSTSITDMMYNMDEVEQACWTMCEDMKTSVSEYEDAVDTMAKAAGED